MNFWEAYGKMRRYHGYMCIRHSDPKHIYSNSEVFCFREGQGTIDLNGVHKEFLDVEMDSSRWAFIKPEYIKESRLLTDEDFSLFEEV